MPKKRIKFAWLRMLFFGFLLVVFVGQTASAGEPEVTYDKASDSLTVQADGVSLEGLLARIAILSGVEFLMDPEVEQPVSITLRDSPLEDGLKKTMQTLNLGYAMIYQEREGRDGSTGPLLISMKVLPKAMDNYSHLNLVPVVDVNGEAVIRSLSGRPPRAGQTLPRIFDYAEQRWQARLNNMPEEKRRRIEENAKRRQERQAARLKEAENHRAEREKKVAEHRARRQAAEEELRISNPELYELRQQQREEILQQAIKELNQ